MDAKNTSERSPISSLMSDATDKEQSTDVGVDLGNGEKAVVGDAPIEHSDFEGNASDGFENETQACKGTYPADCYSFMAVHGPFERPLFFFFGFLVWAFQVTFLILLVLRVAHPKLSTNENDDNPDQDDSDGFSFAKFVPSNFNTLSRWTQYMALLSYCFFADASVKDIVTAVETFPRFSRAQPEDKVWLIVLSCVLRLIQGMLATVVVFLLVVNTSDVIDIILNFTAVNFISDFDDIAFELCQWGKYGPSLKAEADRIETLPAPACIYRKYQHVRYCYTVVPIAVVLLVALSAVSMNQYSINDWLTVDLRIQFKDDPLRYGFNGCYRFLERKEKRVLFESYKANKEKARIGYCLEKRKWYLFSGDKTDACNLTKEEQWAFSSKTYAFDISTVFEDTWYSPTGTPLELYFFDDKENSLSDDECGAFIGDGTCNDLFLNIIDHNYDDGDCCATTCNSLECGSTNKLTKVFKTNVTSGNGYQHCIDPQMKPVTIKINDVYFPPEASYNVSYENQNPFSELLPIEPPLAVECDGKNVLSVNIKDEMELRTETIWVPDGANCGVSIKNVSSGLRGLPFVNYTVFHGDEESIERDPIVIFQADSNEEGFTNFQRIPDCYFKKLAGHVERSTMYTADDSSNQAIQWLLQDSLGFSNCEDDQFLERYALATINFAAPKLVKEEDNSEPSSAKLWIDERSQCDWRFVQCVDGSVSELDLGSFVTNAPLSGTIATEIGLLTNLSWLNLRENKLSGSVPSEIGEWKTISFLNLERNQLTGTIPIEIGNMANLEFIGFFGNQINGTIPSELFKAPLLNGLGMSSNNLSGSIPEEIGMASNLVFFFTEYNALTGTLPTEIGRLSNLKQLRMENNGVTGTIPTEYAAIPTLEYLRVESNALTGSIPTELLRLPLFLYHDNEFSNLTAIDDVIICSDGESEVYCDCVADCAFSPQNCGCEEAQSCCSALLEPYTNCEVCSFGLENPFELVPDYATICLEMASLIYADVFQFGDKEKCESIAIPFFNGIGCRCKSDPGVDKGGNSTITNSTSTTSADSKTELSLTDPNSTSTDSKTELSSTDPNSTSTDSKTELSSTDPNSTSTNPKVTNSTFVI